jgi:hypothetical protein
VLLRIAIAVGAALAVAFAAVCAIALAGRH